MDIKIINGNIKKKIIINPRRFGPKPSTNRGRFGPKASTNHGRFWAKPSRNHGRFGPKPSMNRGRFLRQTVHDLFQTVLDKTVYIPGRFSQNRPEMTFSMPNSGRF
jgi:hypothetical protein